MSPDSGNHDNHDVNDEKFLRGERMARCDFLEKLINHYKDEQTENRVEEERDKGKETLRYHHLACYGKPVSVCYYQDNADDQCPESDSRSASQCPISHYFPRQFDILWIRERGNQ
jgi:hypothetical protein